MDGKVALTLSRYEKDSAALLFNQKSLVCALGLITTIRAASSLD
jgi:hypothetical protein